MYVNSSAEGLVSAGVVVSRWRSWSMHYVNCIHLMVPPTYWLTSRLGSFPAALA